MCPHVTGGTGLSFRNRTVLLPASNGGSCGHLSETVKCMHARCPRDCKVTATLDTYIHLELQPYMADWVKCIRLLTAPCSNVHALVYAC